MKANWPLREAANKTNYDQLYMVYDMEESDQVVNWLFEGVSHECTLVFQMTFKDVLRPFKTKCGIHVTTHLDKTTAKLFNLVKVDTTCIWCVSGKPKE